MRDTVLASVARGNAMKNWVTGPSLQEREREREKRASRIEPASSLSPLQSFETRPGE